MQAYLSHDRDGRKRFGRTANRGRQTPPFLSRERGAGKLLVPCHAGVLRDPLRVAKHPGSLCRRGHAGYRRKVVELFSWLGAPALEARPGRFAGLPLG